MGNARRWARQAPPTSGISFSAGAALACVSLLVSGCGGLSSGEADPLSSSTTALGLLRQVPPPPEATPIKPDQPIPVSLQRPNETTLPSETDAHKLWMSDSSPKRILAFLREHAPSGARQTGSGSVTSNGQNDYWWVTLQVPEQSRPPARLEIAIAPAMGHYDVRVDAVVAAVSKRPAYSFVRPTATKLTISVSHRGRRPLQKWEIKNGPQVRAIAAAVNSLPIARLGGPRASCPAGSGSVHVLLTFQTQGSKRPVAVVEVVDTLGCRRPSIWLSIPARRPLGLDDAPEFVTEVQRLAHVALISASS
jgi:hypothetical protein